MPKTEGKKTGSPAGGSSAKGSVGEGDLRNEVKSFASKLGFVAGGGAEGTFDDFAPSKAKKRISKGSTARSTSTNEHEAPSSSTLQGAMQAGGQGKRKRIHQEGKGSPLQQEEKGRKKEGGDKSLKKGGGKGREGAVNNQEPKTDEQGGPKLPPRDWNTGVGPRPGRCGKGR